MSFNFFKSPTFYGEATAIIAAGAGALLLRQFTSFLDSINPGNHEENLAAAAGLGAGIYATARTAGAIVTWTFGLCCHSQTAHQPGSTRGSTNAAEGAYQSTI